MATMPRSMFFQPRITEDDSFSSQIEVIDSTFEQIESTNSWRHIKVMQKINYLYLLIVKTGIFKKSVKWISYNSITTNTILTHSSFHLHCQGLENPDILARCLGKFLPNLRSPRF